MSAASDRAAGGGVPVMVAAGLERCEVERLRLLEGQPATVLEQAARAERLAVLCEREDRWWEVLERWTFSPDGSVPLVFGRAVIGVRAARRDEARFWRDSAADWRRRAAGQPVCEVIGCGCGGECGSAA